MTSCVSWKVTRPPGLAILFRYEGGEDTKVTRSVVARRNALVQWAPKGSYRLSHVLAYLHWAIGNSHAVPDQPGEESRARAQARAEAGLPAEGPDASEEARARARARAEAGLPAEARQLIVVLDWFAPHLDERVDEELEKSDVACLRIAGGLTCDVQVCDTHRHGPLTSCYRQMEDRDSQKQLRVRPQAMPNFSRQHVFDRSLQAWAQTATPVDGRKEWIQNACLNALDGSEDGQIARDLMPIWMHIGMPAIREQLRDEIEAEVQAGRLHSFWQFRELLEPYDDHDGIIEGMEDAETRVHGDGEDESSDGERDDCKEERRDMEELTEHDPAAKPDAEPKPEPSEPDVELKPEARASAEPVVKKHKPEARASAEPVVELKPEARASTESPAEVATIAPELQEKAEAELQRREKAKQMKALSDAASILRQAGDIVTAQALEHRAHLILKAETSVGNTTRPFLTARSIQRTEHKRHEQEDAALEDGRIKTLDAQYRLAKEETAAKRASAGEARE